ncbi:MAG: DUF364 domain-containing protein [Alphaproteobacteria bacterium]
MNTTEDRLRAVLRQGITGVARRVVIGINWTYVEGPEGAGLVHTPARGTEGCRSLPEPGGYQGRALADLARLMQSDNIFERVLGYAAVNANHNRYDLEGAPVNGLDMIEPAGERTVVIGRFPGLDEKLPGAAVIEHEPGPGDYPPEAAADLVPAAKYLAITAATLSNGSLAALLALAPATAFTVLVGPSAPLCPALFALGIDALSGFVPGDLDGTAQRVAEGGAVSALKPLGRYVTLTSA